MINKDGMKVTDNPKEVREELLRGTGAVMADGVAMYMENSNVRDKQIVVARSPEGDTPLTKKHYDPAVFDQAWLQFKEWKRG
ncbi:hypothetical protein [Nitrospina gracilis]|uniref:hypothetical protein n=1 Tax=Nitrospina gracilis TaxID=35801 RepID=UPI001F423BDB|nr:hypothetical protein [Nitrospina gracilis]MCF8719759.1 hypothetical protein [Nitrospina gracilis Nb-211]